MTHSFAETSLEQAAALRHDITDLFSVGSTTINTPQPGMIRYSGRFLCDPADCYDDLRGRFEKHGFTPMVREENGLTVLIGLPIVYESPGSNPWINVGLLLATILSTLFVGMEVPPSGLPTFRDLLSGWPFMISIMLILGAHELGHYFAARYHKVPVTLPYFIPMPLSIIGTMGAFIRLQGPIKNRRALLDIGVAGPLAGMVFAVPILIIGLINSPVCPLPEANTALRLEAPAECEYFDGAGGGYILEGNSVFYAATKFAVFGRILPDGPWDVQLDQMAWAGWVGLLVTGLNLIPVGQLDGGHIAYVLFGRKARTFFWPIIVGMIVLSLITFLVAGSAMWVIWIGLLVFFIGNRHAEPLDDITPLDPTRQAIAVFTFLLFFLVFAPIPLQFVPLGG